LNDAYFGLDAGEQQLQRVLLQLAILLVLQLPLFSLHVLTYLISLHAQLLDLLCIVHLLALHQTLYVLPASFLEVLTVVINAQVVRVGSRLGLSHRTYGNVGGVDGISGSSFAFWSRYRNLYLFALPFGLYEVGHANFPKIHRIWSFFLFLLQPLLNFLFFGGVHLRDEVFPEIVGILSIPDYFIIKLFLLLFHFLNFFQSFLLEYDGKSF
jgi:hypothetical protein